MKFIFQSSFVIVLAFLGTKVFAQINWTWLPIVGLPGDTITSIASSNEYFNATLYIGTDSGLVICSGQCDYISGNYLLLDTSNSVLPDMFITCLSRYYFEMQNRMAIGTRKGLVYYDNYDSTFTLFNSINSPLPNDTILDIYSYQPDTDYYIGTANGLILLKNDTQWIEFDTTGLPSTRIQCIGFDIDSGTVWVGTDKGAAWYDGNSWHALTTNNSGLPSNDIREIFCDYPDQYWFATWGGGLADSSNGTWVYRNAINGYADSIYFIRPFLNPPFIFGMKENGFWCSSIIDEVDAISFSNAFDYSIHTDFESIRRWIATDKGILYSVISVVITEIPYNQNLNAWFDGDNLIITFDEIIGQSADIHLYNTLGQKLYENNFQSHYGKNEVTIPAENLPSGLFIIQLNQASILKIIKKGS